MAKNKTEERKYFMVPIFDPTFSNMRDFCQREGKKRGMRDFCTAAIQEKLDRELAAEIAAEKAAQELAQA